MLIISVNVGRPVLVATAGRNYSTAINRQPSVFPLELTSEGFAGDKVADTRHHGGPDRAVCCYPFEHYAYWAERLERPLAVPSFGENLTCEGLLEAKVCIGDTLAVGTAIVQISQPRQPCWKLAAKLGTKQLPAWIIEMGYTGFYVRVLQGGVIGSGDAVDLSDRIHPAWTIERVVAQMLGNKPDPRLLAELSRLPELSEGWRQQAERRLASLRGPGTLGHQQ